MSGHHNGGQIFLFGVELLLLSVFSYYGIKWLSNILDPTNKQKQLARQQAEKTMKKLDLQHLTKLTDYELSIATLLVDPLSLPVSWEDIGGLDHILMEIKESVVLPFKRRSLFSKSSLHSPPKGILLYGPPGCGKTLVAKATAKEAGCRFVNLDVSSLTDKWYGESQKLAAAVFSLALKIQPCIIFIDEIDSFLRERASHDNEATAMMKAQFMSLWDGLLSQDDADVIVMGATNRPQDIDRAILRRLPCRFYVGLPHGLDGVSTDDIAHNCDPNQRLSILKIILAEDRVDDDVCLEDIAKCCHGYSGSDLRELCRVAALQNVTRQMKGSSDNDDAVVLSPISRCDFTTAVQRMTSNRQIFDGGETSS